MTRRQRSPIVQLAPFAPQGVVLDVPPFAAPPDAYTAMRNMRNVGAGVQRARGEEAFCAPLAIAPKFAMSCVFGGKVWLLYMGAAGVFAADGLAHYDVTPTTGWGDFSAGSMTGGLLNGYPCFNQPGRPPWYWDGTLVPGGVKPLPGFLAGTQVNVLASFGQHLFGGSTFAASTQYERLIWSDAAALGTVPASWVPTATNQAGELALATGGGAIQGMRGLGAQLMVYRTTGCYAVQYTGRPYIYQSRKVSADVGCASTNSIAEVRGAHVLLAPGDLVIADGTSLRSIGEARVKSNLFSQISAAGLALSHVYATPGEGEVVFCLALGRDDACNVAYVWNYERDKWSVRDLPLVTHSFSTFVPAQIMPADWESDANPWSSDGRAWDASSQGGFTPRAVGVSPSGVAAWLLDEGDTAANGQPVDAAVERIGLMLGDPGTVKLVQRVFPLIEGGQGEQITVQVGAQIGPGDPVKWGAPQQFTIGTSKQIDALVVGRYGAIRFSAATLAKWTVSGFAFEFIDEGSE
jgi:hypothetical protein